MRCPSPRWRESMHGSTLNHLGLISYSIYVFLPLSSLCPVTLPSKVSWSRRTSTTPAFVKAANVVELHPSHLNSNSRSRLLPSHVNPAFAAALRKSVTDQTIVPIHTRLRQHFNKTCEWQVWYFSRLLFTPAFIGMTQNYFGHSDLPPFACDIVHEGSFPR